MKQLNAKQRRFVEEYLVDLNATQAAIRAGYSEKTAYSVGPENLNKPGIAAAIAEAQDKRTERTEIDQDWVIESLRAVHAASMAARPIFDKDGVEKGFSFNPGAANKSLELLGKHLGMFADNVNLNGRLAISHEDALEQLKK